MCSHLVKNGNIWTIAQKLSIQLRCLGHCIINIFILLIDSVWHFADKIRVNNFRPTLEIWTKWYSYPSDRSHEIRKICILCWQKQLKTIYIFF